MHTKSYTDQGIMPDSHNHIARLESKLQNIKNKNINGKLNGKNLLASLKEFNEIYMHDYLKNGQNSETTENSAYAGTVAINYLERKILPEQPISNEETLTLVENDFLSKNLISDQD